MSKHDRQYETVTPDGQKIIMVDGPSEIASWVFPHEPEEDEKRIALAAEIDKLIEASAAWRRSAPIRCSSSARMMVSDCGRAGPGELVN